MNKIALILLQIGCSAGIIAMIFLLFGDNSNFLNWLALILTIVFLLLLTIAPHIKKKK